MKPYMTFFNLIDMFCTFGRIGTICGLPNIPQIVSIQLSEIYHDTCIQHFYLSNSEMRL